MTTKFICCVSMALFGILVNSVLNAQSSAPGPKETYFTYGGEWIFSSSILDVNGSDDGAIVRFSPAFNGQSMLNYDLSNSFGLFVGLSVRNQGFIYQVADTTLRYKFRTYNVGVPAGFKLGTMHGTMVFFGYEIELPVNYKEKRFENEKKEDKFNVWFSDRTEPFFQSVFIGIQGPASTTLTFRYYLTNFHNEDFTETTDGDTTKPYDGFKSNVIALSLGFGLFNGSGMTGGGASSSRASKASQTAMW